MPPRLIPGSPCSDVVLVAGYVQLVFGEEVYSLLNEVEIAASRKVIKQGPAEFAAHLRGLIGQRVVHASHSESALLQLLFESGNEVRCNVEPARPAGTEAFTFMRRGRLLVVEHNL